MLADTKPIPSSVKHIMHFVTIFPCNVCREMQQVFFFSLQQLLKHALRTNQRKHFCTINSPAQLKNQWNQGIAKLLGKSSIKITTLHHTKGCGQAALHIKEAEKLRIQNCTTTAHTLLFTVFRSGFYTICSFYTLVISLHIANVLQKQQISTTNITLAKLGLTNQWWAWDRKYTCMHYG